MLVSLLKGKREIGRHVPGGWWSDESTWTIAHARIPLLVCPSDNPYSSQIGTFVGLHTYYDAAEGMVWLNALYFSNSGGGKALGRTNYLGCAGGMGVPNHSYWDRYRGPFTNRSKIRLVDVRDGTSNTLMFGEALGGVRLHQRQYSHSWMGSGTLPLAWGLEDRDYQRFSSWQPAQSGQM